MLHMNTILYSAGHPRRDFGQSVRFCGQILGAKRAPETPMALPFCLFVKDWLIWFTSVWST
jgi:hypothetical protein